MRYALLLLTGLSFTMPSISILWAQPETTQRDAGSELYAAPIAEAAQRFGIPAAWISAVLHAESAGDERAVSSAGAIGLMQIMPGTYRDLRIRHRLGDDINDPRDNILAGAAYLRELHDRYGSVAAMLAAYNAGPGRYEASLSGHPLPAETRAYVAALAPIIEGIESVVPVMAETASSHAWIDAPLFVLQPDRSDAVDQAPVRRVTDEVAPMQPVRDVSAIVPSSHGLFVRAGARTSR